MKNPLPQPSPQGSRSQGVPRYRRAGEGGCEGLSAPEITYCLNIHPGESWEEQFAAIHTHGLAVRARVTRGGTFPLGLRLSAASAQTLVEAEQLDAFRRFLAENTLSVPTINAFPFGLFHAARVKENVYRPDWRTAERARFTRDCAAILAALLPENRVGSISTVPVGFAPDFIAASDRELAIDRLIETALFLARIENATGRHIVLALEPEPGCVLETRQHAVAFFDALFSRAGASEPAVRRHLGVCLDTCHAALAFESPAETWAALDRAGIAVAKIQIGAALEIRGAPPAALAAFAEPVYLHQVRVRATSGAMRAWNDLPEALAVWPADADVSRVHVHVPLFWPGDGGLLSTRRTLDESFWLRVRSGACPHLEIETYTFGVLPPELRRGTVVDSIAREFAWVQSHVTEGGRS